MMGLKLLLIFLFSGVIAVLLCHLLLRLYFQQIKKKIVAIGLFKTLGISESQIQKYLTDTIKPLLYEEKVQALLQQKIDTFLKKEFSILSHFMSAGFIEKTKKTFLLEIETMLIEMIEQNDFFTPLTMQKINTFSLQIIEQIKRKTLRSVSVYAFAIGVILAGFNIVFFFLF